MGQQRRAVGDSSRRRQRRALQKEIPRMARSIAQLSVGPNMLGASLPPMAGLLCSGSVMYATAAMSVPLQDPCHSPIVCLQVRMCEHA